MKTLYRKVIIVETCSNCPYLRQYMECGKTRMTIKEVGIIPDWCPLDIQPVEPQEPDIERQISDLRNFLTSKAIFTWSQIDLIEKFVKEYAQNQQPEISVTDKEIKDQPKKIFKTSNDYYGINPK